ncbi:MAG: hypothetical protein U9N07_02120 [Euryarchaeota archaeon]|nr:hypothetical protein [Euryarchaeota archaeon]
MVKLTKGEKKKELRERKRKKMEMRREQIEKVPETEEFNVEDLSTDIFEDSELWWDVFDGLKGDQRLEMLYATFELGTGEEFWEELELFYAVDRVFNRLASNDRVEEGVKLLESLREQRFEHYMEYFTYYDYYLIYYYAPLREEERINEIVEHFERDPEREVDHLFAVLDVLRLYGRAEDVHRLSSISYQKLKDSDRIVPDGVDKLNRIAVFSAVRKYITSPDYGTKEAEEELHKELEDQDFWKGAEAEADYRLQKAVKVLRGEIKRDWRRDDFSISNDECDENVFLFGMDFIRYLNIERSYEWVTGELFCELVTNYFSEVSARRGGFYFSFSKEYLDEYLGRFFGFLALSDAKGMAVLKAMEHFSSFLHHKGIFTDRELKGVKHAIQRFNKSLEEISRKKSWKYGFLEEWE